MMKYVFIAFVLISIPIVTAVIVSMPSCAVQEVTRTPQYETFQRTFRFQLLTLNLQYAVATGTWSSFADHKVCSAEKYLDNGNSWPSLSSSSASPGAHFAVVQSSTQQDLKYALANDNFIQGKKIGNALMTVRSIAKPYLIDITSSQINIPKIYGYKPLYWLSLGSFANNWSIVATIGRDSKWNILPGSPEIENYQVQSALPGDWYKSSAVSNIAAGDTVSHIENYAVSQKGSSLIWTYEAELISGTSSFSGYSSSSATTILPVIVWDIEVNLTGLTTSGYSGGAGTAYPEAYVVIPTYYNVYRISSTPLVVAGHFNIPVGYNFKRWKKPGDPTANNMIVLSYAEPFSRRSTDVNTYADAIAYNNVTIQSPSDNEDFPSNWVWFLSHFRTSFNALAFP